MLLLELKCMFFPKEDFCKHSDEKGKLSTAYSELLQYMWNGRTIDLA